MKSTTLLGLSAALLSTAAFGQASSTASGITAAVTIYSPIQISSSQGMDFGTIATSAATGSVVLDPTSQTTSASGGASKLPSGTPKAALFTVTGHTSAAFTLTLPSSISLTGAGTAMTVDTFKASLAGGAATAGPISSSISGGSLAIAVGATLGVGASQTEGTYNGTFNVTAAYN